MFNDVELKQMFDNGDFDDPHYGRPKWEDVVDVNNQQPRSSGFDYEKSEREYQQTGRSFSYEYGKDGKPIKKDDSPPGKKASTKSGGFSYEYGPDGQPKENSADEGQENNRSIATRRATNRTSIYSFTTKAGWTSFRNLFQIVLWRRVCLNRASSLCRII